MLFEVIIDIQSIIKYSKWVDIVMLIEIAVGFWKI